MAVFAWDRIISLNKDEKRLAEAATRNADYFFTRVQRSLDFGDDEANNY